MIFIVNRPTYLLCANCSGSSAKSKESIWGAVTEAREDKTLAQNTGVDMDRLYTGDTQAGRTSVIKSEDAGPNGISDSERRKR